MSGHSVLWVAGMLAGLTMPMTASAQQRSGFRVETELFRGSDAEPFHRTVTLFLDGVAYDMPHDQGQITMIDPQRQRILLLDTTRRVQTEVDLTVLKGMIENARTSAFEITSTFINDAEHIEAGAERITVGNLIRYEATLQPAGDAAMARQYAAFADASAMLNAGQDPAALPYARLNLNQALAAKDSLPKEIIKTVTLGKTPQVHRCVLHANWRLSKDDEADIANVGRMLVSYERVSQQDFFQPVSRVARQSADASK